MTTDTSIVTGIGTFHYMNTLAHAPQSIPKTPGGKPGGLATHTDVLKHILSGSGGILVMEHAELSGTRQSLSFWSLNEGYVWLSITSDQKSSAVRIPTHKLPTLMREF